MSFTFFKPLSAPLAISMYTRIKTDLQIFILPQLEHLLRLLELLCPC